MIPSGRKTLFACMAVGLTLLATAFITWRYDLHEIRPEQVQAWGVPAMAVYAVLIMVLGGLGVPPVFLIVASVAVWSFPVALLISMAGGLGASVLGFLLSRYCIRETVEPRIPAKIANYEHRLETHGLSTVLILRLLFYLFPPINWMLGISAIPLPVFVAATLVGMIPWTLLYLLTGQGVVAFLGILSLWQLLIVAAGVLVGLAAWWRWAVK